MSDNASEKILWQAMDIVGRGSSLTNYEAMTFALQLLAWAKISQNGHLEAKLKIHERSFSDPDWIPKAWESIASQSDTLKVAFSYSKKVLRLSPSVLGAAVDLCVRLAETGTINDFDPTDFFAQGLGREAGEYALPLELAEIMVALANIKPGISVYAPWENGTQLASRAAKLGASVYLETIREPQLPALISIFVGADIVIAHGNPIQNPSAVKDGKLKQFDVSIAFPPLGVRYAQGIVDGDWYGRFSERTTSGTVLAIQHIIAQTRGKAVIAVPHSVFFSPGADRKLREELLDRRLIEAIIDMPSGLLPHTNVPIALLVLNVAKPQDHIRFVNADDDRFREPISKARARLTDLTGIIARATGQHVDELVCEVSGETVLQNDTILQVNRYVLPESTRKAEKLLSESHTQALGEVVSVLRPMPTVTGEGMVNAWEVGAADLPEYAYIAPPSKMVGIDPSVAEKNRRQFLMPLDIVLIIKGSVGKVGIVPEDVPPPGAGGWVVGQSAIILRVIKDHLIDPKALVVYLRSPLGRELLEGIAVKGATIPLIQQRRLANLQIVVPAMDEAKKIGSILDEQAEIQHQIERLRVRQGELTNSVWSLD